MPTCRTCVHWTLKTSPLPDMAPCKLGPIWTYLPPQHSCGRHKQAPAATVEKRAARLDRTPTPTETLK